jgi:hypothetical protein
MRFVIAAMLISIAGAALAQHHQQQRHAPYAGMHNHAVKALSDQQLDDLRSGRGMGLALAAELNGYPGPMHVIELADQLHLTTEQRRRMRELFEQMKAEAVAAGDRLIEHEQKLDQAFARGQIDASILAGLTSQIGASQGELRAVHLKYHLVTAGLLTQHQRESYASLRGYR